MANVLLIALASLLLTGCGQRIEEFGGPTMGSTYTVKYLPGARTPPAESLKIDVERLLGEVDQHLSTYRSDSLISGFNALPAGSCAGLPASVLELVVEGEQLSRDSDGAFDLTIFPLVNLWGFGPHSRSEQIPTAEQIAETRANVGHQYLRIADQQLCKDREVQLDFNSIGAGYAVDQVSAFLEQQGVSSYLVEITGELKARGRKPDDSPWRIGLEAPRDDRQVAQKILVLDGLAVSTSGDYRNYFEADGRRYSHAVDPRRGQPIEHRLASVSVLDPSAMRADAMSTLLMVLGPKAGLAYAEAHELPAFFVMREDSGFVTRESSAFARLYPAEEKSK